MNLVTDFFLLRVILSAIEIYKKWILHPTRQPVCWMQGSYHSSATLANSLIACTHLTEEQYFIQRFFMHTSAIFNVRSYSTDAQKHVELCLFVLQQWLAVGRTLEKRLSLETWAIAIKVRVREKGIISPCSF